MRGFLILAIFTLSSCATKKLPELAQSDLIFPQAIYTQKIRFHGERGFRQTLKAYLRKDPSKVTLIGISEFETTLFKIVYDPNAKKDLQIEVADGRLEDYERELKHFSRLYLPLLIQKRDPQKNEIAVDKNTKLFLKDFDQNRVPRNILCQSLRYRVEIQTIDYQSIPNSNSFPAK